MLGADAVLAEMEALTEQIGLPFQRWQLALLATGRLLLAGHADEAEAANERALELGIAASASPTRFGAYGGFLYAIRVHQGRLDEIADFFIDAARDNPSIAVAARRCRRSCSASSDASTKPASASPPKPRAGSTSPTT